MTDVHKQPIAGRILEETQLSLGELSNACAVHAEFILELVDEGILEPVQASGTQWRFEGYCLRRVRTAANLQRDLGVNLAGVALALELLDEVDSLRAELERIDSLSGRMRLR